MFLLILSASPCNKPLGLQSRRLPDSKITASSEYNQFHAARLGRLGQVKRGKFVGAWCARYNNHYQWLKVDFGRPMKIRKVCTQGRQDAGQWVTSFYLSSSVDNVHWSMYRFRSGNKVRNIPCRYFIIRKKNIYQNTSFKERFFASLYYCYKTENGEKMVTSTIALLSTIYRRNIESTGTLRHVLRILQTTINDSL